MILTRKVKLNPTQDQSNILLETLKQYRFAINEILEKGFSAKTHSGTKLHHQTYDFIRQQTQLPSQLVCSSRNKACEILKSIKQKHKWKTKQPESKKFPTIRFDRNSCIFKEDKIRLSTTNGRIEIPFVRYPYVDQDWNKIKTSCELQYKFSKKQWFLLVMFEIEPSLNDQSKNRVLGIDRGINHVAVLSNNIFVNSKHIRNVKGKYAFLRHKLQSKGTKSAKRLLHKISGKENRFVKDSNHCLSKKIVNLPFDVFVLEKLSIKSRKRLGKSFNKRLSGWSWNQLELFLKYKAKLIGKQVEYVDARYTSQKCSVCGYVKQKNRKGLHFECSSCGFRLHADLNASRNIKNDFLKAILAKSSSSRVLSTTQTSQPVLTG